MIAGDGTVYIGVNFPYDKYRECANCGRAKWQHMPDGKCLFEFSSFKQLYTTGANK